MNNHSQLLTGNGGLYRLASNGTLVHVNKNKPIQLLVDKKGLYYIANNGTTRVNVNKTRLNWKGTKLYYKKNTPEGNQWLPVNLPPEPRPGNRWPPTKIARGFSAPELKQSTPTKTIPTKTITRSSSLPKMNARSKEGTMSNLLKSLENNSIPGFMKHGLKEGLVNSLIKQKDPVAISKALNSKAITGKYREALERALNQLRVNP